MNEPAWRDSIQIQQTLETVFNDILRRRMATMPVVNPALHVQALPFRQFQQDWVGVLITPWFMNLLLIPGQSNRWTMTAVGETLSIDFPYGVFGFTVAKEMQLGLYASCSLYSPLFQFKQQGVAVSVAQTALQGLFVDAKPTRVSRPPSRISRRNLLRGAFNDGKTTS